MRVLAVRGERVTEANHHDHEPPGDAESYIPICEKCKLRMKRVGTILTTTKSMPLYQCARCKGDQYAHVRNPRQAGKVIGCIIDGQAYKLGPAGEKIPVPHPDDVWG